MAVSVSTEIFNELFNLYMAIALVVGTLVIGWLGYILVRYRARPGTVRPADAPRAGTLAPERGHPIWSYVMALLIAGIMFGLAFGTISATTELETPPPEGERVNVTVVGFQFGWRLIYAGEGGVPIAKINDWTLPVDTPIVADIVSQDVWHNFALTEYRIRIDAVPGQINRIWWQAHEPGTIEPVCVQICGVGHALMKTTMHVVSKEEWRQYVATESAREYQRLGNATVNLTFDGATFRADGGNSTINTARAFAVRINNQAATEERFTFGEHVLTLASGQTGLLYAPAGSTKLEALTTGASHTFGGSS
ncbi:MAG TPA: hypothetical protein VFH78_02225 [Candidatus Thermoplasmatota archaeon]|nr:hypothetical protein [Candidatus Thermoplasmatota archaeon]